VVIGPTLIILSGVTAVLTLLAYAVGGHQPAGKKLARVFLAGMTAFVSAAAAYLMYLLITHRFEFQYVYAYSSLDLPLKYIISSFWGGQEGTFLLWLFCGAWLGWIIVYRARQYERWAMVYFLAMQVFLIVVLLVRSPFAFTGMEVTDGRGLNPLLQNPWMVIHPPVVFLGYAVLAVPLAYAMAALTIKDYSSFPGQVLPWVALGIVTLGLGIFLGGYWAYKTLGWGGYWGWDPVENSSLISWLIAIALVHGLLVQRRANKLVRTNISLSICTLLLVVYGTFLTRSGVLADFSVHSFTDLGINAYLVGFMIFLAVFCPGFLLFRSGTIKTERLEASVTSREFGLVLGLLAVVLIAFLVFLGTSAPLLTGIFGEPANVALSYYHAISIPSGILLLLLLVIVPFTLFGGTPGEDLIKKTIWPGVAAAIFTIVIVLFVDLQLSDLVLIFLGLWALGTNGYAAFSRPRFKLLHLGGHLAHLGFALMVLGIVASSNYDTTERLNLITGVPQTAMGYEISYLSAVEKERVEDSYLHLELSSGGRKLVAQPKLFFSEYTNSIMRSPDVLEGLTEDLYLSPIELQVLQQPGGITVLHLFEGQPERYGEYTITFERYETGEHAADHITVGAFLTVAGPEDTVSVTPLYISRPNNVVESPALNIPGTDLTVSLTRILVESRSVHIGIKDPVQMAAAPGKEQLVLEIAKKPFIFLVWLGVIMITIGSILSFSRHWKLAGKSPVR